MGKFLGESLGIQTEFTFLRQAEVMGTSSPHGHLSLIFRVGWSHNQCLFRMVNLNKQRNQLRGAVSHYDIMVIRSGIGSDALPQGGILPVRIGSYGINVTGKSFPQPEGNPLLVL